MARVLIRYRWRYYDEIRGRWVTTRYKTEAEQIHKEHPDAMPVDGTREDLVIEDDRMANCTSGFLRGVTDFGCGQPVPRKKPPGGGLSGGAAAASEVADDQLAALPCPACAADVVGDVDGVDRQTGEGLAHLRDVVH